jgi:hypothetical protein
MHENRIKGLEERLARLDEKEAAGGASSNIDADRASTEAELEMLQGIAARNAAWSIDAPKIAAAEDAKREKKRKLLEAIQFTTREAQALAQSDKDEKENG